MLIGLMQNNAASKLQNMVYPQEQWWQWFWILSTPRYLHVCFPLFLAAIIDADLASIISL